MANSVRLGLIGAHGRMGTTITQLLSSTKSEAKSKDKELFGALEITSTFDRSNFDAFAPAIANLDVLLDVSVPEAAEKYLNALLQAKAKVPFVIGSTGWTDSQLQTLKKYS